MKSLPMKKQKHNLYPGKIRREHNRASRLSNRKGYVNRAFLTDENNIGIVLDKLFQPILNRFRSIRRVLRHHWRRVLFKRVGFSTIDVIIENIMKIFEIDKGG